MGFLTGMVAINLRKCLMWLTAEAIVLIKILVQTQNKLSKRIYVCYKFDI